ncbi:CocE/NonD family hydrolase [Phytohabitans flavus]
MQTPKGEQMSGASVEYDVAVAMRDGAVLRTDVYRPQGDGPWPVLVVRGPYNKKNPVLRNLIQPLAATDRGYMVVIQDTRSRFASEGGAWRPWAGEGRDGADTIEWAARLPDSTGKVAILGPSYQGNTTWMAAIENPNGLVAIAPTITWADPWDGLFGRGGAIELGISLPWSLGQGVDVLVRRLRDEPQELGPAVGRLFSDFDGLATGVYAELPAGRHPAFQRHQIPDLGYEAATADPSVADSCTVRGRHHLVKVPSFNTAGWFDIFLQGSLDNFVAASQTQPAQLIVGPWSHAAEPHGAQVQGEVNFGFGAGMPLIDLRQSWHDMQLDWLDRWMRPENDANAGDVGAKVKLFVMGINQWRDEDEWPLSRAVDTSLYFSEGGQLSSAPDPEPSSASFDYDPMNPVPTLGGALLMSPEYPAGVFDQAKIEGRDDVLTYTSAPLEEDLEVTGRVRARLHAATDGPSTDWVVRLCYVDPGGVSRNVTDGILRVSAASDQVTEYEVDLWSTSMVFRAGHRVRVQVTSSCFPRWDRNLNTGESTATATRPRVAHQTIHHGVFSPSQIILPVVPQRV